MLIGNDILVPSHGIGGFGGSSTNDSLVVYIYIYVYVLFDNIEINKHLVLLFSLHKLKGLLKKTYVHLSRRVHSLVTVVGD